MNKIKLGIIYGGLSTEHEVSIKSYTSIKNNLDKDKYEIYDIYIGKDGFWYDKDKKPIENIIGYLKKLDVVFPILHGRYGEDGTIQGLLEMFEIPYVGPGVLSSSLGMDKVYSKILFKGANIPIVNYVYIKKSNDNYIYVSDTFEEKILSLPEICEKITEKITFPMFVKPSNSGSSVGINKAHNTLELIDYIEYAGKFDSKILIEEAIIGKEIECAIIGNSSPIASYLGEIIPDSEFYSYDSKYNNGKSLVLIPADLSKEVEDKIKEYALKAFKVIDSRGLSRVDFFIEDETSKIYLNEINTIPGFTEISMYPKLWEYSGLSYKKMLDQLISLALDKK